MSKQINIAIEGFDGSGKSTIAKHLSNFHCFEYHKSPSGNFALARTFFDKTTDNVDERIAFYLGDCIRISNLMHSNPKINFALDRYYYSTMAYHEAKYPGIMSKFLKYFDLLNPPDVVFLIHTEYDILRNRITERNDLTSNDALFLDKILFDKIYSLYIKYINVPVIDIINNTDMATALKQVDFELNEFLKKKK